MTSEPGSGVSPRWVEWRRTVDLDQYDRRWESMAAQGRSVHGELDFVERLFPNRTLSILDAGCGTGRLAVEAARRGHRAVGVDLDPDMIERAAAKSSDIPWMCADLSSVRLEERFDVVVMAGNIPLFCAPGTQGAIVSNLARHLASDGVLVCGFSVERGVGTYTPNDLRRDAMEAGLGEIDQYATWEGDPLDPNGTDEYAVVVCRRAVISFE